MKKLFACAAIAGFAMAMTIPMVASSEKTLTGQVIDVQCTLKDKANAGPDHLACATKCAERGQPVGILADDGIYTITGEYAANKNAKLIEYLAKKVEVTGTVSEKDGQKTIDVSSIKVAKGM
jgi:hypothetical protein